MNPTATMNLYAPETGTSLILLASRIGGLFLVAPVFSSRLVPMTVRTSLVIIFTVVLFPAARSAAGDRAITPAAVLGEMLVGFAIGVGAALLIGAMEVAGDYIAVQIGLSGAALLDPMSNQQSAVLGTFLQLFAVTLLLSVGGHLLMLEAVSESTQRIPLGSALTTDQGLMELVNQGASLFALGLRFAAPVIAVALVANVALAVLSRAAPQLNILQLAFPVQILAGLATLIAAIPILGAWWMGWETTYADLISRSFSALGAR
jgi:flagellar biosynthetic protein FliR